VLLAVRKLWPMVSNHEAGGEKHNNIVTLRKEVSVLVQCDGGNNILFILISITALLSLFCRLKREDGIGTAKA